MTKSVSEVPMDDIRLGTHVVGATGKQGAIVRKRYARDGKVREDEVDIIWGDGTMSNMCIHSLLTKVMMKEYE